MVSTQEEGGIKEAIDEDNNIIISDSTLRSIIPPQLKNMYAQYKLICGCECCISSKSIHSSLLSWRDCYLRKLKNLSQMHKTEVTVKIPIAYLIDIKLCDTT